MRVIQKGETILFTPTAVHLSRRPTPRRLRPGWTVRVFYGGGTFRALDRLLEYVAGRRSSGSGCMIRTGERDIDFDFWRREAAERFCRRLRRMGFKVRVRRLQRGG